MFVKSFLVILIIELFVLVHGILLPRSKIRHMFTRSLKQHLGNGSNITAYDLEGFYSRKHLIWKQEPYKTFTDCLEDFPEGSVKGQDFCLLEACLSPEDVFQLSRLSHNTSSDEETSTMAMILLHLLQSKSCLQKLQTNHKIEEHKLRSSSSEIWGYGVLSTSIIALTTFGGVLALPFVHGIAYKRTLLYLAGLAIGTLAGSSLFFLIPEALELTEHDMHRPSFVWNCQFMVIAIYTSFIIERVLKMIKDWRERCKKAKIKRQTKNGVCIISLPLEVKDTAKHPKMEEEPGVKDTSKNEMIGQDSKHIDAVAWMIIAGDALHNFIDGVSVGAAFTESVLTGVSVSVAVFCEELPHELGDFAILLCEGLTKKQAIICNVLSACTIYIGLSVGVFLGQNDTAHNWMFAFAAGLFLYVALVDMMPEMCAVGQLEESRKLIGTGNIFLLQNLGMVSGFGIMFILALYGGHIAEAIKAGS